MLPLRVGALLIVGATEREGKLCGEREGRLDGMDDGDQLLGVEKGDGRTEGDELDGGDEAFPGSASSLVAFTLIPHESPLAVTSSSYVEFQYTKRSSSTARILALSTGPPASDGLADGVRVLV